MGFFTLGLLYGANDFGSALCAGVNCGYDTEAVGGALGAVLGIQRGLAGLPQHWMEPIGDILIPGIGLRDLEAPYRLSEIAERTCVLGRRIVAERCPDIEIVETPLLTASSLAETPVAPAAAIALPSAPPTLQLPPPEDEADDEEPDTVESVPLIPSEVIKDTAATATPEPDKMSVAPGPGIIERQTVSEESLPLSSAAAPDAAASIPALADYLPAKAWTDSTLVKPLLVTAPSTLIGFAGSFLVVMDPGASPTIGHDELKTLSFSVTNSGDTPFNGRIVLLAPSGWQISGPPTLGQRQFINAKTGTFRADFTLRVPEGQGRIAIANAVTLRFLPEEGAPLEAEFVLMGASCWWTTGPFANYDGEGFHTSYMPEDRPGLNERYNSRLQQLVGWEKRTYPEPVLDLEPLFKNSAGVVYGQTILRSPTTREARLVANTNNGVKVWLNGQLVLRRHYREAFRPMIGSGPWAVDVTLRSGDNPVMVKWVRGREPYEFSLTVSDRSGRGLPEVGNTSWL
jgi:hypothetical protein